jgi:ATP-dependent Zn protease
MNESEKNQRQAALALLLSIAGLALLFNLNRFTSAKAARFLSSPLSAEERNYSERTAEQIDEDARRIMDESYERVKTILTNRRAKLERIAEALIAKETLTCEEINQLLAQSSQSRAAVL